MVLESGKPKIKVPSDSWSSEDLLFSYLLAISSEGRWDKGDLWDLFYEDIDPTHEGSILIT